ncbi:MAG: MscS Mechanosensitive ion channel [Planctomycetaceae bacterium]|nr:MscS Mechanosensitive ion channel [Planctomycetaceae bacterium]
MDVLQQLAWLMNYVLNDDRFAANVTAIGVGLFVVLLVWLLLRSLLATLWATLSRLSRNPSFKQFGEQAVIGLRNGLWWLFVGASIATLVLGGIYHLFGGDVGREVLAIYNQITPRHVEHWLRTGVYLAALGGTTWYVLRWIRRTCPLLEQWAHRRMGLALKQSNAPEAAKSDSLLTHAFIILERYANATTVLISLLTAGHLLKIGAVTTPFLGFALRVTTVVVLARLLILLFRTFAKPMAGYGDKYFSTGRLNHYWDRLGRLLPLGERCFEMAVYISAATLCGRELKFIHATADSGERLVLCIGIFFGTRVLIELMQVLLNEVFGLYREDHRVSQQARTLVPLLQSVSQYSAYFGGGVWMLKVMGFPTEPILAGAGIVGLAVGLGAQSLVTDVVSGLFILFENQFLVGDYVEIGGAQGVVEAVAVRHTQVRDDQGKLHIIPNGQIKCVVNYSKGFLFATVEVKVPAGADVDFYLKAMAEAGRQLRRTHTEVLADTSIQGIIGASLAETTVRAITKVKPGFHQQIENEFRRLLKGILDQQQGAMIERRAA